MPRVIVFTDNRKKGKELNVICRDYNGIRPH